MKNNSICGLIVTERYCLVQYQMCYVLAIVSGPKVSKGIICHTILGLGIDNWLYTIRLDNKIETYQMCKDVLGWYLT